MRKIYLLILIFGILIGFFLRDLLREEPVAAKVVTIKSRNLELQVATKAKTVGELLEEQGLDLFLSPFPSPGEENEEREPSPQAMGRVGERLYSHEIEQGQTINIRSPINITLADAGSSRHVTTTADTVGDLLNVEKIGLAATDKVTPNLENYLADQMTITIDRIVDLEVTENAQVPFATMVENDPEVFYGQEKTVRAGIPGKKEQRFLIIYKNGVEIKRKLLKEKILEVPVAEVKKFGTKIEVEMAQEGRASWYAYKGCLCAAHPSYDFGRYVRVTNLVTGKSIIVRINDRGPDLAIYPDRVIDLDSTAFKALAPLGAGTIGVRVELLKN